MCPNLFFVKGSQPQEEYSRCGRHKLVDNQKRVLLIMPICFLALLMSSAIWFENFRSNCSITPKYLQWLMCSTKCTLGLFLKGGRHYIIQSAETVSEAGRQWSYTSSSPMFFPYVFSGSRLAWNLFSWVVLSTILYIKVSLAKRAIEQSTWMIINMHQKPHRTKHWVLRYSRCH